MISLSLKSKEVQSKFNKSEEMPAYRNLLLLLVKLIHADPMLLLSVSNYANFELILKRVDSIALFFYSYY